jgi:tetratricopeptide (TPR) repeat protein
MDHSRARGIAPALLQLAFCCLCCLCFPGTARANAESASLRARATAELYNLDHERALANFRAAVAADPQDPAAHRGLAIGLWVTISFRRGNMTVDDYLGGITRQSVAGGLARPEAAAAFRETLDRALGIARKQVEVNPRDAEAHYQVGAALGLRASYIATVEGSPRRAFQAAREAFNAHEKVLSLDARRKDAGLVVGTYRYIVSVLSLPLRWAAYMAGFGGDKARGIRMVEDAMMYGGDNQEDARFALILVYNREKRYDQALQLLELLRAKYPQNRLVWLERGSTSLRAGRPGDADRFLSEGLARFANDNRPRMFGENALWLYKRGAARAALRRTAEAEQDLRQSVSLEGRKWVHGRAHLELGKLLTQAGNRIAARGEFQTAAALCDADNDRATADEARRLFSSVRLPWPER